MENSRLSLHHGPVRTSGRVDRALRRIFARRAIVLESERIARGFHLLTLGGEGLRDAAWAPGQKIQIVMNSVFVARTYTPIHWDAASGRTRLLGYAHGDGPGSRWIAGAAPGEACDIIGPRTSIDAAGITDPIAAFGDETSIGLVHAVMRGEPARIAACHMEAGNVAATRQALAHVGLDDVMVHAREASGAHLLAMEAALAPLAAGGACFVLTGNARTVQRLRHALRALEVPAARVVTKAYWTEGKTGLD